MLLTALKCWYVIFISATIKASFGAKSIEQAEIRSIAHPLRLVAKPLLANAQYS